MTKKDIVRHFGGTKAAAAALGVTRQTIHNWGWNGIPPRTQAWIQLFTAGKLNANVRRQA